MDPLLVTAYFPISDHDLSLVKQSNRSVIDYIESLQQIARRFPSVKIATDYETAASGQLDSLRSHIVVVTHPAQTALFYQFAHALNTGSQSFYSKRVRNASLEANYLSIVQSKLEIVGQVAGATRLKPSTVWWLDAGVFQHKLMKPHDMPSRLRDLSRPRFGVAGDIRELFIAPATLFERLTEGRTEFQILGTVFGMPFGDLNEIISSNKQAIQEILRTFNIVPTEQISLTRALARRGGVDWVPVRRYGGAIPRIMNARDRLHPGALTRILLMRSLAGAGKS